MYVLFILEFGCSVDVYMSLINFEIRQIEYNLLIISLIDDIFFFVINDLLLFYSWLFYFLLR